MTNAWLIIHVLNVRINLKVITCIDGVPVVWCENLRVVSSTVTKTFNRCLIIGCDGWCAVAEGDFIEGNEAACLIPYGAQRVASAQVCCQAFGRVSITVCTVTVGDSVIVRGAVGWLAVPGECADTVLCDHASLVNTVPWLNREGEAATVPGSCCGGYENDVVCGGCADDRVQEDGGFLCCDVWDSVVCWDEVE